MPGKNYSSKRYLLLPLIMLLLLLPASPTFSREISFRQLSSEDGISQSEIYCFLHDSKGYMWFGTVDGLNKYDGYSIISFTMDRDEPHSLVHNTIYALSEDRYGRIWIGTDNGLNVYDPVQEKIFTVPNFHPDHKLIIRSLLCDDENLWIGSMQGFFRLSIPAGPITDGILPAMADNTENISARFPEIPALTSSIGGIIKSRDGKIWLGTWDRIISFDFSQGSETPYQFMDIPEKLAKIDKINCITEDRQGSIWIGTQELGLHRYISEYSELASFNSYNTSSLLSNNIKSIATDLDGNIWIGNFKEGLNKIESEEVNQESIDPLVYRNNLLQPGSLSSNMIRSLYVSGDGLLWIGTLGRGINIYNPLQKQFRLMRIPPLDASGKVNNFIRSVYKDPGGDIWLGMHLDGLIKYDASKNKYLRMGLEEGTVFQIFPAGKNHLWLATSSGVHLAEIHSYGINIRASVDFDKSPEIIAFQACFDIVQTAPDIFWVASMSGIVRIKLYPDYRFETSFYNDHSTPSLSYNNTRVLAYDGKNHTLWAGTEGGGLNQIILDSKHYPREIIFHQSMPGEEGISSNYIRSLCLDNAAQLWIGTYEGLNLLMKDEGTGNPGFRVWKKKDGLPNNMIQSIQADRQGRLWMGTNGGLVAFDPTADIFTTYSVSDGLQSKEFAEHASFQVVDGTMYFGGINGLNVFSPEQIETNTQVPSVAITDFYLFNQKVRVGSGPNHRSILTRPIHMTDSLILRSRENDIRFDFSALVFSDPEKIKYAWKLDGYDQDWIITDATQRSANYTNLRFGKYIFMVKATNSDGVWNEEPTRLYIQIQTPFWLTLWAMFIYLSAFGLLALYFTRYSIIRITSKKELILENEHNQRLHELDMLRTRFFINISHDLRTPLTLITGPLENILKNFKGKIDLREQIELVNRNAKRLKYLVDQLLDIRKVETGKLIPKPVRTDIVGFINNESSHFELAMKEKGLGFSFLSSEDKIEANIDRDMIAKVLFNLLSNAIKFTEKGKISIEISREHAKALSQLQLKSGSDLSIRVEIRDTGPGLSPDKTSRIFERFYQDPDIPGKGYGIGLSHSKDLIEAHQGRIDAISKPGEGTAFVFYLPIILQPGETVQETVTAALSTDEVLPEAISKTKPSCAQPGLSEANCILLIEDNADLRTYLKSGLNTSYRILESGDGEDGLLLAQRESPDLIISDIMMPKMDGIEFCKNIKTNILTSHIPVILLTARVDSETKYKGIETGADDYISKPFEMEYLCLRIKNLLDTREHLRNLFQKNISLEPSAVTVTSSDENFLKKLILAIEEGIPEPDFSVESLEKDLGMSHTNFYRKIKNLTGQSGKELLQNMRLKRAAQLITQQTLRISEVAYMTGFTNPKYFSKCFREKFGLSPTEYLSAYNSETPANS